MTTINLLVSAHSLHADIRAVIVFPDPVAMERMPRRPFSSHALTAFLGVWAIIPSNVARD